MTKSPTRNMDCSKPDRPDVAAAIWKFSTWTPPPQPTQLNNGLDSKIERRLRSSLDAAVGLSTVLLLRPGTWCTCAGLWQSLGTWTRTRSSELPCLPWTAVIRRNHHVVIDVSPNQLSCHTAITWDKASSPHQQPALKRRHCYGPR